MSKRDTQRSKVYAAERDAFKDHAGARERLDTVEDIARYVRHVFGLKRVQQRFPIGTGAEPNRVGYRWGEPRVNDGRGRRRAYGSSDSITMPVWSRCKWIVLHELAHTVTIREKRGIAAHGWEYCETYLTLVRLALGVEAHDLLKAQFKAHRVRYRPKATRAPLSPERKAALIATLAAAREVRLAA